MTKQIDPNKAIDYLIANASKYAQAKADRVYLEQYRKTKKALLYSQAPDGTIADKEAYAYAHEEYRELLEGLKAAVAIEEELRWKLKAAEMRADVWRTQEATNRVVDRSAA